MLKKKPSKAKEIFSKDAGVKIDLEEDVKMDLGEDVKIDLGEDVNIDLDEVDKMIRGEFLFEKPDKPDNVAQKEALRRAQKKTIEAKAVADDCEERANLVVAKQVNASNVPRSGFVDVDMTVKAGSTLHHGTSSSAGEEVNLEQALESVHLDPALAGVIAAAPTRKQCADERRRRLKAREEDLEHERLERLRSEAYENEILREKTETKRSSSSGRNNARLQGAKTERHRMKEMREKAQALNDLHCLSIETMTWLPFDTTGTAPSARNNHTSTRVGTRLFVHGGHGGSSWLDDLFCLDTKRKVWSKPDLLPNSMPPARACHTLTRVNQKLYMFGGYDGQKCFNSLEVLDLDTMAWMTPRIKGSCPEARNAHTMTAVGTKLYLFGGHSGNKHLHDLYCLDVETMSWSQPDVQGPVPPGLRGHSANLVGKQIFIFGGYDGRLRSNEMYILETGGEISSDDTAASGGSSGDISPRSSLSSVVRWKQVSSDKVTPVGRQRHTSCVLGTQRLHVFGGFDGHKWLNDLHVLDAGKFEKTVLIDQSICELLGNLQQLLNNENMFSDITFLVEGRAIYAHKAILAVQCDHFNAMFGSGMRESTAEEIVIPGWDYAPFLSMLEFLYTGTVADFTVSMAVDLLPLADHYTLDRLRSLCESVLVHHIDAENVCTLFVVAHRSSAVTLKKSCLEYILGNWDPVSCSANFDELSKEPQLLLEVTKASLKQQKHRG
eukprot:g5567.t1